MVTGVAGFIGSHLAETLVANGHFVIGVDNREPNAAPNIDDLLEKPNFRFVLADASGPAIPDLLDRVGVIFHLAAATGVRTSWGRDFARYVASNVVATQRLLEYCA